MLPPRSSSRIQNKLEEKKRQEELQRMRAEEEKRRRDVSVKSSKSFLVDSNALPCSDFVVRQSLRKYQLVSLKIVVGVLKAGTVFSLFSVFVL